MTIENDPRLTAYALGELGDEELRIFEQELANAGGANAALREVRDCIERIREAFSAEPQYCLSDEQRAVLLADSAEAPIPLPLPLDGEIVHSDKVLPWVTQPVISEVDKQKVAESLEPSKWHRAAPLVGSLGVAAAVMWLLAVVLQHEAIPKKRPASEVATTGADAPSITIDHSGESAGSDWIERRRMAARNPDAADFPYRYGAPLSVPAAGSVDSEPVRIALAGKGFRDPSIEGERLSRFPVNVGLGSYQALRKFMLSSLLPPADSLKVGELLNAFAYSFPEPSDGETFAVDTEVAPCPWDPDRHLLQIGVRTADDARGGPVAATVAEDVEMAVEFNPATVAGYRRIGEAQSSASEEMIGVASGEKVASGHTVTALYEVVPREVTDSDASSEAGSTSPDTAEFGVVRVDYRETGNSAKQSIESPVSSPVAADWRNASDDIRFAASVAGYGMLLGAGEDEPLATGKFVLELARDSLGEDSDGKRSEFVEWIEKTLEMSGDKAE